MFPSPGTIVTESYWIFNCAWPKIAHHGNIFIVFYHLYVLFFFAIKKKTVSRGFGSPYLDAGFSAAATPNCIIRKQIDIFIVILKTFTFLTYTTKEALLLWVIIQNHMIDVFIMVKQEWLKPLLVDETVQLPNSKLTLSSPHI